MTNCRACGLRIESAAAVCPNCGAERTSPPADPATPDPATAAQPLDRSTDSEAPTEVAQSDGSEAPTAVAPASDPPAADPRQPPPVQPQAPAPSPPRSPASPPPQPSASEPAPPQAPRPPDQQPPAAATPPPSPPQPGVGARIEQTAPGAGELAQQLREQATKPGIAFAGLAALITVGVMFAFGLILALLVPENSLISVMLDSGGSTIKTAFRQTAAFTLAGFKIEGTDVAFRVTPAIFGLMTLAIAAISTGVLCVRMPRIGELSARARFGWAAASGLPIAILLVIIGLISKESNDEGSVEVVAGSVFLLGLMWGALGGVLGAARSLRREGRLGELGVPPSWVGPTRTIAAALRPLGVLLALCAVIGTAVWVVQTIRDAGDVKSASALSSSGEDRSTLTALVDHVLYIGDHGVHYAELGAATEFHAPITGALGLPAPVTKVDDVVAEPDLSNLDATQTLTPPGSFRIFDYSGAFAVWLFIPALGLIILVALAALYAGFAVARSRGPLTPGMGAAWGALVGPIWGVTMVVLNALVQKDFMGKAVGDSVFTMFLLGGAMVGALGGLLAAQGQGQPPATPAATTPSSPTTPPEPPPTI